MSEKASLLQKDGTPAQTIDLSGPQKSGGGNPSEVHGIHSDSNVTKIVFQGWNLIVLILVAWLLLGDGLKEFKESWGFGNKTRRVLLFCAALIYAVRLFFTAVYMLPRSMGWAEVIIVGAFLAVFQFLMAFSGGIVITDPNWIIWLGVALYIIGSFINTYSELQRKWWKQDPANKGHLYTLGLFSLSMHINYFGDMILFSGWSLLGYKWWCISIPVLMTLGFIFQHIPELDKYLAHRYPQEFLEYAAKTKKLIPFIY